MTEDEWEERTLEFITGTALPLLEKLLGERGVPCIDELEISLRDMGGSRVGVAQKFDDGGYRVSFNTQLRRVPFDETRDVVLHELAHVMHFVLVEAGKAEDDGQHGDTWKALAKALGARPDRVSDADELADFRKARRYRYMNYDVPGVGVIPMSRNKHVRVQAGEPFLFRECDDDGNTVADHPILPDHFTGESFLD